jgi:uncharacterized integral membrane protein
MRREPDVPSDDGEEKRPGQTDSERKADEEHLRDLQRARQARVAKVIAALAIAVILIIFIVSNSQPVKVNFVFFTRRPGLIWIMFTCAVLGGILGYLIGRPGRQVRLHRKREDQGRK